MSGAEEEGGVSGSEWIVLLFAGLRDRLAREALTDEAYAEWVADTDRGVDVGTWLGWKTAQRRAPGRPRSQP